jgi:DNA-binding NarL/FixJ family response regulator
MRVLLAEHQAQVRSALRLLLTEEPGISIVDEASEAGVLLAQINRLQPDLVLLDWELPGLATIGSLSALRLLCPNLLMLVLSGWPGARQEALAAGADDFFCTIEPPEQLFAIIRSCHREVKCEGISSR